MPSPSLRLRLTGLLAATAAVVTVAAVAVLPAAARAAEPAPGAGVVINEIESDGDAVDWVELVNTSAESVDISGWVIKDDKDDRTDALPTGTILAPGAYYVAAEPVMSFGLGKADVARLYLADGTTLVDSYAWTQHAKVTFGRCPDGVGAFVDTTASTRGAANNCSPVPTGTPTGTPTDVPTGPAVPLPAAGALVVNEVESNGDDTDWFELYNTTNAAIDITGFVVRDNDDSKSYVLPAGSIVPAHGILLVDQLTAHSPGFDFGLGNNDEVRLFGPDGVTLVAKAAWLVHAPTTSYGLCPDGVGELRETTVTTKGAPNNCSLPVAINEVESSGGTPGDWIELVNLSESTIAVGGLVVTDSDVAKNRYTIPANTTIAAKGYLVLEEADFSFGLGGTDAVRLFDTDGVTELDATSWTGHAATTWGRCANATGAFGVTLESTKGAANRCAGEVLVETWPGGTDVRVLDAAGDFEGDLSGLDYADGVLWAVENGNGLLYRGTADASAWTPSAGWENGKKLRYPSGTGAVDAEGVTALGDRIYVSTERNNDQGSVSRPSVLRFNPSASGAELVAEAEWNLAADFPGLAANGGLEGITWVPDSWLVAQGFVDQRTQAAYTPASYAGHGDGLFFVGVEGTAKVYAYALQDGGAFARVATIDTSFALVADVQFDRDVLWVICDEACAGQTAVYEINDAGAFEATHVYARPANAPNVANEGFAIASSCVNGSAQTFYADDADTDGFSLRSGSLDCTADAGPVGPTPTPTPTAEPTSTPEPTETPTGTPTPGPTAPSTTTPTLPQTGSGAPSESALTDATRGGATAPASVVAGGSITVSVPAGNPGQATQVWMFSTPTDLGAASVTASRTVTVTVPKTVAAGIHRVVVVDAAGDILGWTEVRVTGPGLAATGGDTSLAGLAGVIAVLALAAGAGALHRARRRTIAQ